MQSERSYFLQPKLVSQKQYEALRAYFVEEKKAQEVATEFGYSTRGFSSLIRDFRLQLKNADRIDPFFAPRQRGRKERSTKSQLTTLVTELRKKNLSVPDIKVLLDAQGYNVSERAIYLILSQEGFSRLPRRDRRERSTQQLPKIRAAESVKLDPVLMSGTFSSHALGLLCFLPYIKRYGIDRLIAASDYPETGTIDRTSSIMAFLALKMTNVRRYVSDDLWCMDRGLGLFAGLTVLPKTAWFSSYSFRVTKDMNRAFLVGIHRILKDHGLVGDTANVDFTTIPYWGDSEHLENNWSGKRRQALASMLCFLAHDPDTGILDYGTTDVLHRDQPECLLEFLDFYRGGSANTQPLRYLVFDSRMTNYETLNKLNGDGIRFVTIRRRGKRIIDELSALPTSGWKRIRVPCADNKGRWLRINEQMISLKHYDGLVRQIAITGHGKVKPALIITNDLTLETAAVIRKYTRRWLIEKNIAEQIEFFHLNRVSSSMVIKIDFDLVMTILAHNLYRLFALDLTRHAHQTPQRIYEQFIVGGGDAEVNGDTVRLLLKKKRMLPIILQNMQQYSSYRYDNLNNHRLIFEGDTMT